MSKRHSTKYKIDRRMGENIWGRPKSPVNKRAYAPGQHGANARRGKMSDFGTQLRAKQKLKATMVTLQKSSSEELMTRLLVKEAMHLKT